MTSLLSYSLAVSVLLLFLAPVTQLVVNRNSFHGFNRSVILSTAMLSIVMPGIFMLLKSAAPVATTELQITLNDVTIIDNVTDAAQSKVRGISIVDIVTYTYYLGMFLLAGYELSAWARVSLLIRRCRKETYRNRTIYVHNDQKLAPFSFMRCIVMSEKDYNSDSLPILLHESAHIAKRHWLDLMFMDAVAIFLWYNPMIWLMRDKLRQIHEFEADRFVIAQGVNAVDYQKLLINTAIDRKTLPLTNSFANNGGNFRKRIMMIGNKAQNGKGKYLALLLIPTCIIATAAVNNNVSAEIFSVISGSGFDKPASGTAQTDTSIIQQTDDDSEAESDITVLPSPFVDQKPLANYIYSIMLDNKEEGVAEKITVYLLVNSEGKIVKVNTKPDNNPNLEAIIQESLNLVEIETTIPSSEQKTNVKFALPVNFKGAEGK